MHSKEDIIQEIEKQGIPFATLSEHQQKSLLASIRMKMIYEPLPKAAQTCYRELAPSFGHQLEPGK